MTIWPIFVSYAVLVASAWAFSKWLRAPSADGRFASLDGMRGYLAFGVLIHHGAVWYFYLRTGEWKMPPSHVYNNLGQASVVMFFMITAFLFWSKLLRGRVEPVNWRKLYLSRFLRLVPLYAFAMVLLALTVAVLSHFQLNESLYALSKQAFKWSAFTILGDPDINKVDNTHFIIAGVTWTLIYEWLFYIMLPLIGLMIGVKAPRRLIVLALIVAVCIIFRVRPRRIALVIFGAGALAAYLVRFEWVRTFAGSLLGTLFAIIAAGAALKLFPTSLSLGPVALLAVAFTIIAAGNSLFGLLAWDISRLIGEITYSVYLLHGIILFWVFRFLIGFTNGAAYSLPVHWLVMCCCIPFVFAVSCLTFRYIESPAMQSLPKVACWMRERKMPMGG